MKSLIVRIALLLLAGLVASSPVTAPAAQDNSAVVISELIRPAKLATLGKRGANPRVQKCVYWLATTTQSNQNPTNTLERAIKLAGYTNAYAAQLTRDALLRNLDIAEKLGCLDTAGLADMRKGQSPTIQTGRYKGDELSVDHIVPRAVCPELDNVIANLELMPLRMNQSKNDKIGERQVQKAKELHRAGLLSVPGLNKIKTVPVVEIVPIRTTAPSPRPAPHT